MGRAFRGNSCILCIMCRGKEMTREDFIKNFKYDPRTERFDPTTIQMLPYTDLALDELNVIFSGQKILAIYRSKDDACQYTFFVVKQPAGYAIAGITTCEEPLFCKGKHFYEMRTFYCPDSMGDNARDFERALIRYWDRIVSHERWKAKQAEENENKTN